MKKQFLVILMMLSFVLTACVQNDSQEAAKQHENKLSKRSGNIGKKSTPAPFP